MELNAGTRSHRGFDVAVLQKAVAILFGTFGVAMLLQFVLWKPWRWGGFEFATWGTTQIVFAGIAFAVAHGLWRLRRWARWSAIGISTSPFAAAWIDYTGYSKVTIPRLISVFVAAVVILICVKRPSS